LQSVNHDASFAAHHAGIDQCLGDEKERRMAIRELLAAVFAVGGPLWWFSPAHDVQPDPLTTASVTTTGEREFTVSNMQSRTVCLISRGTMTTHRSSSVIAGEDCMAVWPGLERVRNWTDNGDGTFQLTDGSGEQILSLGLGDGVAYESLEPADASIALTAAN
jgi:hypothetical protein